jgi:hypothetical protein
MHVETNWTLQAKMVRIGDLHLEDAALNLDLYCLLTEVYPGECS